MKKLLILCLILSVKLSAAQLTFHLSDVPADLSTVQLYGSQAPLSWEKGMAMQSLGGGRFTLTVSTQSDEQALLEYKYRSGDQWESLSSNRLRWSGEVLTSMRDKWSISQPLDASSVPKLSAAAVKKDIDLLAEAMETLHPGLYRYQTAQQFAELIARTKASVRGAMTHREAYFLMTELAAAVKCGHTHTNPWNQGKLTKALVYQQADRLPASLQWINRRLWVAHALEGSGLHRGDEILAINNVPTARILQHMLPLTSADGSNDANRISRLQLGGAARPQWFDILLTTLTEPVAGHYTLQVRTGNDKIRTLSVAALDAEQRAARFASQGVEQEKDFDESWAFRMLEDGIGYLRLGTFSTYKMNMDWRAFIDEAFALFKQQSRGVIIDIRGNGGGMPEVSHYLTSWVSRQPVTFNPYIQRVVYEQVPDHLRPYLGTWDNSVYDMRDRIGARQGRFYPSKQQQDAVLVSPKASPYDGQVVLLVDGANSSATFTLAREWQRQGLATLVGHPTGGSMQGINGGVMLFMTLPGSGVEVDIPLIGYFPEQTALDKGVTPDVAVTQVAAEWARGRDKVLDVARQQVGRR